MRLSSPYDGLHSLSAYRQIDKLSRLFPKRLLFIFFSVATEIQYGKIMLQAFDGRMMTNKCREFHIALLDVLSNLKVLNTLSEFCK